MWQPFNHCCQSAWWDTDDVSWWRRAEQETDCFIFYTFRNNQVLNAGGRIIAGCPSVRPVRMNTISEEHLERIIFKFGTKIHYDSRTNWLEGQRSLWPCIVTILMNVIFQNGLEGIAMNLAQTSTFLWSKITASLSVSSFWTGYFKNTMRDFFKFGTNVILSQID